MEQNKQFEDAINSITTAKENLATAKYVFCIFVVNKRY